MKVTDLEKFSLEQIWRPYWPTWLAMSGTRWDGASRLPRAPMGIDETAAVLRQPSIWRDRVVGRLAGIRVQFPPYIVHPLVDTLLELVAATKANVACMHATRDQFGQCRECGEDVFEVGAAERSRLVP